MLERDLAEHVLDVMGFDLGRLFLGGELEGALAELAHLARHAAGQAVERFANTLRRLEHTPPASGAGALPSAAIEGASARGEHGPHLTPLVTSVRPYTPGDAFNRIHWRSSARHQELGNHLGKVDHCSQDATPPLVARGM